MYGGQNLNAPPPGSESGVQTPPSFQENQPGGDNGSNEPLYFTSVKNTDKFKKKGKKPINPRHNPKKSFFQKLFNKDPL